MRNLIIITIAIMFGLTSCQKEQIRTNTSPNETEAIAELDFIIHNKKMNTADAKSQIETNGIVYHEQLATTQIASPRDLAAKAKSRSKFTYKEVILCDGSLEATNKNEGNDIKGAVYQTQGCLSYNLGYEGEDVGYLLWVEDAGSFDINLSKLNKDLDIFLYSLDQNGDLDQCLGYSINGGAQSEYVNADLGLGTYAIIIDGYSANDFSNFKLEITCVFGYILFFCDDLEYNNGALTSTANDWIKFSTNSGDATVTNVRAHTGNKSVYFNQGSDVVNLLGKEYFNGVHYYSWQTYLPKNKSAAFAFEKYNQPGKEQSIRVFLEKDGSIEIVANGKTYNSPFKYSQDKWVLIDVTYSLNSGTCALWIDGNHVANFDATLQYSSRTTGKKQLAGINFWGFESDSEFYID